MDTSDKKLDEQSQAIKLKETVAEKVKVVPSRNRLQLSKGETVSFIVLLSFIFLGLVSLLTYSEIITEIKNLLPGGHSEFSVLLGSVMLILIVFSIWALWFIPKQQVAYVKKRRESSVLTSDGKPFEVFDTPNNDEKFSLENEARKTLAQIIGGVLVLLGLFGTAENLRVTQENLERAQKNTEITQKINERGQVTDRFTKAIGQLGDKQLEIRLGGIYALEKIAQDYPQDYHSTIMEILTAYVRENALNLRLPLDKNQNHSQASSPQSKFRETETSSNGGKKDDDRLPADIEAIMTVIGRRFDKFSESKEYLLAMYTPIDLRNTNLKKIELQDSNLSAAYLFLSDLHKANLRKADLSRADLRNADLSGADLSGADLRRADLRGADLRNAELRNADLRGADLRGADLRGADLSGADLSRADLSTSKNLTWEQIEMSIIDEHTKLPLEFEIQKQQKLKRQKEQEQTEQE